MSQFEDVYETLVGHREAPFAVPGVQSIAAEGSAYSLAYQTLMDARLSLTRRFGMDFEDKAFICEDLISVAFADVLLLGGCCCGAFCTARRF